MLKKYCDQLEFFGNLSKKWAIHILFFLLLQEKAGFMTMKRSIKPITSKILSARLKMLQELNFVAKEVVLEQPLRVIYFLTDEGRKFIQFFIDHSNQMQENKKSS